MMTRCSLLVCFALVAVAQGRDTEKEGLNAVYEPHAPQQEAECQGGEVMRDGCKVCWCSREGKRLCTSAACRSSRQRRSMFGTEEAWFTEDFWGSFGNGYEEEQPLMHTDTATAQPSYDEEESWFTEDFWGSFGNGYEEEQPLMHTGPATAQPSYDEEELWFTEDFWGSFGKRYEEEQPLMHTEADEEEEEEEDMNAAYNPHEVSRNRALRGGQDKRPEVVGPNGEVSEEVSAEEMVKAYFSGRFGWELEDELFSEGVTDINPVHIADAVDWCWKNYGWVLAEVEEKEEEYDEYEQPFMLIDPATTAMPSLPRTYEEEVEEEEYDEYEQPFMLIDPATYPPAKTAGRKAGKKAGKGKKH